MNSLRNVWVAVFVLIFTNKPSFGQQSPCPKIVRFYYNGFDWSMMVALTDLATMPFTLKVEMGINTNLTKDTSYFRPIDLRISRNSTTEFKILFSLPPVQISFDIIRITLNDVVVCAVPSDGRPLLTILTLEQKTTGQIIFDTTIKVMRQTQVTRSTTLKSTNLMTKPTIPMSGNNRRIELKTRINTENLLPVNNKSVTSTNCGQFAGQIVGPLMDSKSTGEFEKATWPWLAAIYANDTYICVGTLICSSAVLTAASCVHNFISNNITVYLGLRNLDSVNQTSAYLTNIDDLREQMEIMARNVSQIYTHFTARPGTADGDIAILELSTKVKFSDFIQPGCLWAGSGNVEDIVGRNGFYAGWDKDEKEEDSKISLKASTRIVSEQECIRSDNYFADITSSGTFCAGLPEGGDDCPAYLGAGYFISVNQRWMLRGILSQTTRNEDGYCSLYNYDVYTDVAKYLDWIKPRILS